MQSLSRAGEACTQEIKAFQDWLGRWMCYLCPAYGLKPPPWPAHRRRANRPPPPGEARKKEAVRP